MPEAAERAFGLLIDKVKGRLHFGDPARHSNGHTEMPRPPGHFLPQGDQAGHDAGHRFFPGLRHRVFVGVDATSEVKQFLPGHACPCCAFEGDGHGQSMAALRGPRPGPRLAGYTYFRLSRSAFNWAYCSVAIQAFAASIEAKTG